MVMIAGLFQHHAIGSINILMCMNYGVKFKPRIIERQFDAVWRPRLDSHVLASRENSRNLLPPENFSPAKSTSTLPQDGCKSDRRLRNRLNHLWHWLDFEFNAFAKDLKRQVTTMISSLTFTWTRDGTRAVQNHRKAEFNSLLQLSQLVRKTGWAVKYWEKWRTGKYSKKAVKQSLRNIFAECFSFY